MNALHRTRAFLIERSLTLLGQIARRRGSAQELPVHLSAGIEGEQAALLHLCALGYQVVARRWSSGDRPGDVDLIAWNGPLLCFVEVKSRTVHDANPAEITIDHHKLVTLRYLARRYLRLLPSGAAQRVRFDVVSVYLVPGQKTEAILFEGAYGWLEGITA